METLKAIQENEEDMTLEFSKFKANMDELDDKSTANGFDFDPIGSEQIFMPNADEEEITIRELFNQDQEEIILKPEEHPELFMKDSTWETLNINNKLVKGLLDMNFVKPSMVQAVTFPLIMKKPNYNLLAQFPNGYGKTAAFGLGLLTLIDRSNSNLQAIIFAHTREMVNQISNVLLAMAKYTGIKIVPLLSQSTVQELGQILVLTPGTFDVAFFKKKKTSYLSHLKVLVLDEADYLLSFENSCHICEKTFKFLDDLKVQFLFFSATFTKSSISIIRKHIKRIIMLERKKETLTLGNVRQMYIHCQSRENKVNFVEEYLKRSLDNERIIIFVNTRDYTDKLAKTLIEKGYKVQMLLGGNQDVENRDRTVSQFNKGEIQILITTNVLSRGFDEKLIKLIINFDVPFTLTSTKGADYDTYLHRIGRTGRFGSKGIGLSLVANQTDLQTLMDIKNYFKCEIEEIKCLKDLMAEFKKILNDKF